MEELIVRIKSLLDRIDLKTAPVHIKIGDYLFNATKQILTFSSEIASKIHAYSLRPFF